MCQERLSESKKKEYETLLNKTDIPAYSLDKHLRYLRDRRFDYIKLLREPVEDEEVAEEYQRRVETEHRSITNVQVLKVDFYKGLKNDEAGRIFQAAVAGEDPYSAALDIIGHEKIDSYFIPHSNAEFWSSSGQITGMTEEDNKYSAGDVWKESFGARYSTVSIVKEVTVIPLLEAKKEYPWRVLTIYNDILTEMTLARYNALFRSLREKADIKLDGQKVELPNFDELFNHGKYRRGTTVSRCFSLSVI